MPTVKRGKPANKICRSYVSSLTFPAGYRVHAQIIRAPNRADHPPRGSRDLCVVQGLLLDLDAATLTVWVNGERKGVMVRPGMIDYNGEPLPRLEGPLRWAVGLAGASVAIAGPLPLPG